MNVAAEIVPFGNFGKSKANFARGKETRYRRQQKQTISKFPALEQIGRAQWLVKVRALIAVVFIFNLIILDFFAHWTTLHLRNKAEWRNVTLADFALDFKFLIFCSLARSEVGSTPLGRFRHLTLSKAWSGWIREALKCSSNLFAPIKTSFSGIICLSRAFHPRCLFMLPNVFSKLMKSTWSEDVYSAHHSTMIWRMLMW